MKIKIEDVKIEIKLSNKQDLGATVTLTFGDVTIKGYRLSESQHENEIMDGERLYLQPPSYKAYGRYHKLVFINDEEKWKEIQRMVFKEYLGIRDMDMEDLDNDIWPKETI